MKTCLMKVNYDQQKYHVSTSSRATGGVRQVLTAPRTAEDSSLKTFYHLQNQQARLKVCQRSFTEKLKKCVLCFRCSDVLDGVIPQDPVH